MIDTKQAQTLIADNVPPSREETVFLSAALGRVTALNIYSPIDLPLFDNSAMDGFLLSSRETAPATSAQPVTLAVRRTIKAGSRNPSILEENEACHIMTGAPIADRADTVVAKEKADFKDGRLFIHAPVTKGLNIRSRGEELKKGDLALAGGTVIHPGVVGFLAMMGINRVRVMGEPKISLLATGSELIAPGQSLSPGKIYDANTSMLKAALAGMKLYPVFVKKLMDEPRAIKQVLSFALKESDLVILTGGVSVGDYDFVKDLLAESGVKTLFWTVSQKPGKPLFAGIKDSKLVFGLPGNPAAVFTCFYEYVYPAIRKFMGYSIPYLRSDVMRLGAPVKADADKTLFIKGKRGAENTVFPLRHQQSHMLSSLSEADCLIVVPPSPGGGYAEAEAVAHTLPYAMREDCC